MIEVLFSLSISLIIILNCSLFFRVLKNDYPYHIDNSIENGIATLSYELLTAHNFTYGDQLIFYNEKNEKCIVVMDGNRLVITPGHNIICHDLKEAYFYNKNGLIYVDYYVNDHKYTYMIGSDYELKEER